MALQNTTTIKKYIFLLLFCFIATVSIVHAADSSAPQYVPLIEPGQGRLEELRKTNDLSDYLNTLFQFSIGIGAMLAVGRLVYAGWLYMSQDAWGTKSKAKEIIKNAIIGLLLLSSIWLILYQINPCILKINILTNFAKTAGQEYSGCSQNDIKPNN